MSDMKYELMSPALDQLSLLLHETLFHNANGYIGVRSCFEEGYPEDYTTVRGAYINGFYDFVEMKQAENLCNLTEEKQTILNVADPQGISLQIGGETFSMFSGDVLSSQRVLDMQAGTTNRAVHWHSPQGKEIRINMTRMASFRRLPLFLMKYELTSGNYDGEAALCSSHNGEVRNFSDAGDPRVAAESFQHLIPQGAELEDGISCLTSNTSSSGLTMCSAVSHRLEGAEPAVTATPKGHGSETVLRFSIRKGETVTLYKYCIFTDSLRFPECRKSALELLNETMQADPEALFQEQQDYLRDFWNSAMLEIDGDNELNQAVRFNMYQLMASAGKDRFSNVAAKGLSGEGYEGHFFWDTEMYMQPFFNLTSPETSKSLITYRYQILEQAKANARRLGHRHGALYPWRTIMGKECSGHYPSGAAQYHINGDIAYSVVNYYLATGDAELLTGIGAEILFETARLWLDAGVYADGKFCIQDVTGPDEYTCLVNNNYYTNASAQYNLHWAAKVYEMLDKSKPSKAIIRTGVTEEEAEAFRQAAEAMYLPYDETLGINPQDDSFLQKKRWDLENEPKENFPLLLHYHPLYLYRHQVCKQADTVLAHFVFEDAQDEETIRKSFAYYEQVTTHDSSLSTCIFSIVASKLGLTEKAYAYFGDSAKLDLFNTHHNTKDGIHTANMGGNYMAIVYGFGGLRTKESGLSLAPRLPGQWDGLKFRIRYHGSLIAVSIRRKDVQLELLEGKAQKVQVYDEDYLLQDSLSVSL